MIQKLSERSFRQDLPRKYIKEINGHLKGMMSKRNRNRRMSEECMNHVLNGLDFMLCFSILRRSMETRELEEKTIIITKSMKQHIVVLTTLYHIKTFIFLQKLCLNLISE